MHKGLLTVFFVLFSVVFLIAQSTNQQNNLSLVLDNIPPVAVCKSHVQISLTDNPTKVFPVSFDDGSYDEECLAQLLVKRMNEPESAFKPFMYFTCDDIANSPVKVVLRAVDCEGNVNDCWSEADVEDKTKPVVVCPADLTIFCTQDPNQYFTQPTAIDNCGTLTFTSNVIDNRDQCQNGYVSKIWTVKDNAKNQGTCTHRIYSKHVSDYTVTFPSDVTINKCVSPDDLTKTGEPIFKDKQCDLLAVGHTDHDLPVTDGNGCFVRIRKWQIINWCTYDPNKATHTPLGIPVGNKKYKDDDGFFEYTQYIKVFETADPVLTCKDTTICFQNDCEVSFDIPKPAVVDCSQNIYYSLSGDLGSKYSVSGVKSGVYQIQHNVSDGCGNHSFCNVNITVKDCKKPTPVVHQKLATTLMVQNGLVEVWASDFETSSYDNCTKSENLKFSFSPDKNDISKIFNCDSLGLRTVKIWVTDEAGNQDYAIATIDIQDNMNACDTSGTVIQVSGSVKKPDGSPMVDVHIKNPYVEVITDSVGYFATPLLNMHLPYTMECIKQEDPKAGLSVLDAILLRDHILGYKKLSNPYQYLAGDVDKSKGINTYDLFLLKQMILGHLEEWPKNQTFNYIGKKKTFDKPEEIWNDPTTGLLLDSLATDSLVFDLVAIKTGDLSDADQLIGSDNISTRASTTISFVSGNKINYTGDGPAKGIQFAVNIKALSTEIYAEQGTISITDVDNGMFEVKYITDEVVIPGQTLLSWHNTDKNFLPVLTNSLQPMSVAENNELQQLDLKHPKVNFPLEEGIFVYPNPAKNAVRVKITSAGAQKATIEVIDLEGKVIDHFDKNLIEGVNLYALPINTGTGIFIIKVETQRNIFQEKISIIE